MSSIDDFCKSDNVSGWRFEQSCEGNRGRLEWILYDNVSGKKVASTKPWKSVVMESNAWFRDRYRKATRPFTVEGGVVFASDEYGHNVLWKLKKNCIEDQCLKWNVRACIWLTYWPNNYKNNYREWPRRRDQGEIGAGDRGRTGAGGRWGRARRRWRQGGKMALREGQAGQSRRAAAVLCGD
ncbi:hypothetical protein KI387_006502, partial [Taxus chinensis]